MQVAIVGYGIEGQSAARYWSGLGAQVTICDQNTEVGNPEDYRAQLGERYLEGLDKFDVVVRSAGINPGVILAANPGIKDKLTTVIDEFLRVCPSKNIIGVTGTKGKGTTSTLIARMLTAAGKKVFLGGNIGTSPFDFLGTVTQDSWIILELSSFQLYDVRHSPHIGICLMVVPEHLNWHDDMQDYIQAKSNMFRYQNGHDVAIYFADDEISHRIASTSPGAKIPFYANPGAYIEDDYIVIDGQQICRVNEIKLLGKHNWQNACAAVTAVWQIVQDITPIKAILTTFAGLEHRLEFVRAIDGVSYYDDSFGTTPETAIVALQAFKQPKVVILGGSDKGASYDGLGKAVSEENVRHVVTIGETAPAIEAALQKYGFDAFTRGGAAMPDIVHAAQTVAKKGDVVLLSTGSASFGLFKDYKDRGEQFKLAVGAL